MQTPDERIQIELVYPNQTLIRAELSLWDDYADMPAPEYLRLALRLGDREIVSCEETYWAAFCVIRAELEQENILACCYGGSRNVYPSGMCLGMGTGDLAYRLQMGEPAKTADLVNIFHTGPEIYPASLMEQENFHTSWIDYFKKIKISS
jgi:hypothetical protein